MTQDQTSRDRAFAELDRTEILRLVFYPRRDVSPAPPGSRDYAVTVGGGISIGCRFYMHGRLSPSVLFFHGNGEVVCDYDEIGPIYNRMGINLMVADYRGYGSSGGTPSFSSMVSDARSIFKGFLSLLEKDGHSGGTFVMGRSLGSVSAIELARHFPERVKGVVIDSGFGSILRLFRHLGFPGGFVGIQDKDFPNLAGIRSVRLPTLIIHGECDLIAPVSEASALYRDSPSAGKKLVIIPGAGHNDIMVTGAKSYFPAIREFVFGAGNRS